MIYRALFPVLLVLQPAVDELPAVNGGYSTAYTVQYRRKELLL